MKESEQLPHVAQNFPIVGIGASAGGISPIKKLLSEIPTNSGMAYVIVQHLHPDYESNLIEILIPHSKIPVHEIISEINLVPNHVYVIPENNNLVSVDGKLQLEKRRRGVRVNRTIDVFFESLAEVHKTFAVGIVLSGTAFDGTMGLKRIKECGGVTIVQEPETADFKTMPKSAIDAEAADYVLAPEKIPAKLIEIHSSYETNNAYGDDEDLPDERILSKITDIVFVRTGNEFKHYKQPTIRRRVARRMVMTQISTLNSYYNYLRNDIAEQDALFNDLLIPVTYFFRDEKHFEKLSQEVFPALVKNATDNNLRIWVAGCSTGEEAYSVAILLHEFLSEKAIRDMRVQIFASDLSEKSIAKARSGIYSTVDVQQIGESRRNNYFTKREGHYHINKVIRDMCVFAIHSFIKDPPFARIDLIACRNVLIYFDSYLQEKVMASFHYALKEKGFLFLGKSESAGNTQNLFEPLQQHERIYMRKFSPRRYMPQPTVPVNVTKAVIAHASEPIADSEMDFKSIASELLFKKYMPVAVIINDHHEIIHIHGDTGYFLLPSPGKPNFNLIKMAREDIGFELRSALSKIKKTRKTIGKEDIAVKGQPYLASFEIIPLNGSDGNLMVLFYKKPLPEADSVTAGKSTDKKRADLLETEITHMREDAKRITEEQQTAYEELQTINEELLSSSEELQALNEELETSTEELQSNNEELMCVNDELIDRQEQLISLRNYSESIINTIREPLIIIDNDFTVISCNPAYYRYFETSQEDTEGLSFFDIGDCQWNIAGFREQLKKVMVEKTNVMDYRLEVACSGKGKKTMMINMRTIVNAKPVDMLLIAIEDVSELQSKSDSLKAKNIELEENNNQLKIFSTAASQDLQEPLRKIQMFCSKLISEKHLSTAGLQYLERLMHTTETMDHLVNDLIDYTRITLPEADFKKTNLNAKLKKLETSMKPVLDEKKAVITVSELPQIKLLQTQVMQLFTNLISNSIKYAQDGNPPTIKIWSEEPTPEEIRKMGGNADVAYVKINFNDNGIGFNEDHKDRIFEPFYRLHSKDKYEGSGLGLSLVKKIVANHDGFITVSSQPKSGTTFHIYFPVV